MIALIKIVLISILILLSIMSLSTILTFFTKYKTYKQIYKTLPNRKFYINGDQVYSRKVNEKDDYFVWFTDTNEFRLNKSTYIHSRFPFYFNLYTYYWLTKYRNWFEKNVDLNTIEQY